MNADAILKTIQIILTLEPAAFGLVEKLVQGVAGKSDAEILAEDDATWALIVTNSK